MAREAGWTPTYADTTVMLERPSSARTARP